MLTRDKLFMLIAVIAVAACIVTTLQGSSRAQVGDDAARFQMQTVMSEMEGKGAVFVLDTQTGNVWAHRMEGDGEWVAFGSPED